MSYCRWSSDDCMCDLYCYESCYGGWTTHVARSRRERRPVPSLDYSNSDVFMETYRSQMEDLKNIKLKPIGLPHDGETFNDETIEKFLERIIYLKSIGYSVPDSVIYNIREEIKESENNV